MKTKITINRITIKKETDCGADTSCIGEYTDKAEYGVINRRSGEFLKKKPFTGELDLDGVPELSREYRFFKPYAGDEKPGTRNYKKYGMQDYKRMEGLNNGDWFYMGITAEAEVSYDIGNGNRRIEKLTSGGLWGIESDAGEEYINEVIGEQLEELRDHLETFGVDLSDWSKHVENKEEKAA